MVWTDYYLKFADKAGYDACAEGLQEAAVTGAIDEIGMLFNNDTGMASAGYHVNVRLDRTEALPGMAEPYVIAAPALPKRVFMDD